MCRRIGGGLVISALCECQPFVCGEHPSVACQVTVLQPPAFFELYVHALICVPVCSAQRAYHLRVYVQSSWTPLGRTRAPQGPATIATSPSAPRDLVQTPLRTAEPADVCRLLFVIEMNGHLSSVARSTFACGCALGTVPSKFHGCNCCVNCRETREGHGIQSRAQGTLRQTRSNLGRGRDHPT